ncbi:MAG: hypothetical protein ABSB67_08180 [Bryobacteraceae bacterium]|jgi:hypothetical protein
MYPSAHIPVAPGDLNAIERGNRIVVRFTAPALTTDAQAMPKLGGADVFVAMNAGQFTPDSLEDKGFHAKVTAAEKPGPVEASATLPDELLSHQNVTLVVGARVLNTKGRPSAWSNLVTVHVVKPVAAPSDMVAAAAPEGVRVTWTDPGEHSFRVFRKGPEDKDPVEIGKSDTTQYIDQTIVWGTAYQYWVQALRDNAESDVIAHQAITPVDKFAPAVPAGLTAVTAINSIELAWERNTETDLKTYIIYRATGTGPLEKLAETDVPVYADKAIETGERYRYAVSAIDIRGNESAKSAPVEATAP